MSAIEGIVLPSGGAPQMRVVKLSTEKQELALLQMEMLIVMVLALLKPVTGKP
jgi:hypothetical protein